MGSHLITVPACSLRHVVAVRKSVSARRDSDLIVLLDNLVCLECEWSRHMHSLATPWKLTACRKPLSCHVVNKFPLLYWTQGLIDYVCRNLSLARRTTSYLCTVLYDSLISCHPYLGFPCALFPSGYQVSCLDILLLLLGLCKKKGGGGTKIQGLVWHFVVTVTVHHMPYKLDDHSLSAVSVYLTLRLLMSYSYIYIYIYGAPILDVSRSHTTTHHSR